MYSDHSSVNVWPCTCECVCARAHKHVCTRTQARVHICSASLSALSDAKNMAKDIKDAFLDVISSYITAKGETAEALCVMFPY